jgi:hypothetical protein
VVRAAGHSFLADQDRGFIFASCEEAISWYCRDCKEGMLIGSRLRDNNGKAAPRSEPVFLWLCVLCVLCG